MDLAKIWILAKCSIAANKNHSYSYSSDYFVVLAYKIMFSSYFQQNIQYPWQQWLIKWLLLLCILTSGQAVNACQRACANSKPFQKSLGRFHEPLTPPPPLSTVCVWPKGLTVSGLIHRRNPAAVRHRCAQRFDSKNKHSAVAAQTSTVLWQRKATSAVAAKTSTALWQQW